MAIPDELPVDSPLSEEVVDVLERLSSLDSLLPTEDLVGLITKFQNVGTLLIFMTMVIAFFRKWISRGFEFKWGDYIGLFSKSVLILMFFGIGFSETADWLFKISNSLTDFGMEEVVNSFRASMRKFLYTAVTPDIEQSVGSEIVNTFVNSLLAVTGVAYVLKGIVMILMMLVVGFIMLYMSIGQYFVIMAIMMGPLCMALSIIMPSMARSWLNFLLGSMFFALVTSIVILSINEMEILGTAATGLYFARFVGVLLMLTLVLVYLVMVPFLINQIFGVTAFGFVGRICGWIYGLTIFLAPIAFMTEILSLTMSSDIAKAKIGTQKNPFDTIKKQIGGVIGKFTGKK